MVCMLVNIVSEIAKYLLKVRKYITRVQYFSLTSEIKFISLIQISIIYIELLQNLIGLFISTL